MANTPAMSQYLAMKEQYQDSILLYRMGDFYEMFYEDAITASKVLGITLTSRNPNDEHPIPLAGFPYHSVDKHLPKLLAAGFKVAVCEQTEDAALAKGPVKRDVVEVVTRGTAMSENCLEAGSNNYLAALAPSEAGWGLSYMDLSTGLFAVMEGSARETVEEVHRLGAGEVAFPEDADLPAALEELRAQEKVLVTRLDPAYFNPRQAEASLLAHFQVHSLEAFGCGGMAAGMAAAAAALRYAQDQKRGSLPHLTRLTARSFSAHLNLDSTTIRNLEILHPIHSDDETGALVNILDRTVTAMGARKLKYWLTHPLLDLAKIRLRQDAVAELMKHSAALEGARRALTEVNDIERIVARAGAKRANARDLTGLGRSLAQAARAVRHLEHFSSALIGRAGEALTAQEAWGLELAARFTESPPLTVREGGMLDPEKHPELKAVIDGAAEARRWMNELEPKLRESSGIPTLKVGFNKIFGYYLEVSKAQAGKAPADFIRKQTLVNGERYITPEMKERENEILNAETRGNAIEYDLFCQLRDEVAARAGVLLEAARMLATVDVLCALARVAAERGYIRPELDEGTGLHIVDGRHPVVEALAEAGTYIPNDVFMDTQKRQLLLITGPNMAGKSTYLRQTALICLLAQTGSFVPAKEARLGLVDRIFTRVGASDRLARGQSTFMVEMIETAGILHNATPRSLILLDEVGRGTSTFDGLSLAWAIVEALHETPAIAARTLFATHYHELTELPKKLGRAVNVHIAVKETGGRVIFLRKILEGGCDSSYGIQVAAMAGIPGTVIARAQEILATLEREKSLPILRKAGRGAPSPAETPVQQQDFFAARAPEDPRRKELWDEVLNLDTNRLSPLEALNLLSGLQKKFSG